MHSSKIAALLGAAALLLVPISAPVTAQEIPRAVTVAERLAGEGRHGEAADTLLAWLRTNPEDAGVRWRAAQLLDRAGRTGEAADQFARAVVLDPRDPWLRLEYATLLESLGRVDEAARVVGPVAERPDVPEEARVRALALLGRLDFATRPWIRLSAEGMDDNQPYRRAHGTLEGGIFLTPLWTAGLALTPRVVDPAPDAPGRELRTPGEVTLTVGGYLPGPALEVTMAAGGLVQDGASTWTGHAGVGLRLGSGVSLRGRAERERYLWSRESADTLLMVETVELALDAKDRAGWAGETVVRLERFPDGNGVRTVYAWLLAPTLPGLRLGAAASWQDADESRWSPALQRYAPYFTPEDQRVASALAEVTIPLGGATARINGDVGAWARERVPTTGTTRGVTFFERSYTPWSVRASLDVPAGRNTSLHLEAERSETAFYALGRAAITVVVRPGGPREP